MLAEVNQYSLTKESDRQGRRQQQRRGKWAPQVSKGRTLIGARFSVNSQMNINLLKFASFPP